MLLQHLPCYKASLRTIDMNCSAWSFCLVCRAAAAVSHSADLSRVNFCEAERFIAGRQYLSDLQQTNRTYFEGATRGNMNLFSLSSN